MRGVQHPMGPESEGVYWRRRAGLVGVSVLVLVLLIWLVGRGLGGRSDSSAVQATPSVTSINPSWTDTVWDTSTPTPSPVDSSPAVTPTPTGATASGSPAASGSATASASGSGTPASPAGSASGSASLTPTPTLAGCQLSQLRSAIAAPSSVVKRGSSVPLTVTVTNQGKAGCLWDLKTLPVEVTIASGSDRIWSTADCAAWGPSGAHPIAAGKQWHFTVKWPTKRSASGSCTPASEELGTGTYVATATVKGGTARKFVMRLTA